MTHRNFQKLDTLLDEERQRLLRGEIEGLEDLIARKEALLSTLPEDADGVAALRQKAVRNQALIEASLAGIKRAAQRMKALQAVRRSLKTYDQNGTLINLHTRDPGDVERHA